MDGATNNCRTVHIIFTLVVDCWHCDGGNALLKCHEDVVKSNDVYSSKRLLHDLNSWCVSFTLDKTFTSRVCCIAKWSCVLETNNIRSATEKTADAVITGWMFRTSCYLTWAFDETAKVERSTACRVHKRGLDVVIICRTYHVSKTERGAHDGIIRFDTIFAHTYEGSWVVGIPK